MLSSTWTSASFEHTSGSSACAATIEAQRPAISADPGASGMPADAISGCAPIAPIAPDATSR